MDDLISRAAAKKIDKDWCSDCDFEPTHWMPLPEPPKEQKKRIKDHVCGNDYCELE